MNDVFEEMKRRSLERNKQFRRDVLIAIFLMFFGVTVLAWCIGEIIKGCC